jgi:hypothetical protein
MNPEFMKKNTVFILLLLVIPGLLFLNYIGVFIRVKVTEKTMGPYYLVYKNHVGEYKFAGQTIAEVRNLLLKNGYKPENSFGIYYDDPKKTKIENLRSKVGWLVNAPFSDTLLTDLHYIGLPKQNYIYVEYPNRNFLSIYSGIAKVHPKLYKYAKDQEYKKSPVMEIYTADKIIYLMAEIK